MSKYLDAYGKGKRLIPCARLLRREPIPDDTRHMSCDVIVLHEDVSYHIMQHDPQKHCGGMWEATAGGSALQGESGLECAVREPEHSGYSRAYQLRLQHGELLHKTAAQKTISIARSLVVENGAPHPEIPVF